MFENKIRNDLYFLKYPHSHPSGFYLDPRPSQEHAGLQDAVLQQQQVDESDATIYLGQLL